MAFNTEISELPSSRARFAAHDTLRWKYPFTYETLKANTLKREKVGEDDNWVVVKKKKCLSLLGEDFQFWAAYFSNGVKPPTR